MHAFGIISKLIGSQAIRLHQFPIRVALFAGRSNIRWMNRRARVTDWKNVMCPVTVGAHGDMLIAFVTHLPMNAGVIKRELVGAERRVERLHAFPVGMAGAT